MQEYNDTTGISWQVGIDQSKFQLVNGKKSIYFKIRRQNVEKSNFFSNGIKDTCSTKYPILKITTHEEKTFECNVLNLDQVD